MQTKTFPVHPTQTYRLDARLTALVKQAAKVGAEFDFTTAERAETKDTGEVVVWTDVTVRWTPLVLAGGWTVAGVWETDEGSLFGTAAPGADGGTLLRTRAKAEAGTCDHCGYTRQRSKVIVVANTEGEEIVVGTTCVKDFLGVSPSSLLNWLSWEETLDDMADEDWDLPGASSGPRMAPPVAIVAAAIAVIRALGYTPRSKVDEWGKQATADIVGTYIFGRDEGAKHLREEVGGTTDEDRAAAQGMVDFFADEAHIDASNDYLFSLHLLAAQDMVKFARAVGYLTSLPSAYHRETEKMDRREAERAEAAPIPVNGERITVVGKVLTLREQESQYGITLKALVKADAGWKVWGTVPKALRGKINVGDRIQFDAAVEPSRDDPIFGFFNRPTKAKVA